MDEADTGVELRVAGETLFDAWHPDQNQTDAPTVKDAPHLLKPSHFKPIRFVDDEQSCWIRQGAGNAHRTIPLLIESVLRLFSLVTSITVWVPFRVAQLFGVIKNASHSRVFVTAGPFDCGIMQ